MRDVELSIKTPHYETTITTQDGPSSHLTDDFDQSDYTRTGRYYKALARELCKAMIEALEDD